MNKGVNHIDYNRIAKYLSEEMELQERQELERWIKSSDANMKVFDQCKKVFSFEMEVGARQSHEFDTKTAWKKVSARIDLTGPVIHNIIPELSKESSREKFNIRVLYRIAAVVIIGLATTFYFLQKSDDMVTIASNLNIKEVLLPDSSMVTLNQNSSIVYNMAFGNDNREISLRGTAYFDVKYNEDLVFTISTESGIIEVLGTAFLIEETDQNLVVTVERGQVRLSKKDGGPQASVVLKRNEKAILFRTSNEIEKSEVASLNNLYWANKKLIYKQVPLASVLNDMGGIFGKTIKFDSLIIEDCKISAVFNDETFENMINNISLSMDFRYQIRGDTVEVFSDGCQN